MSYWVYLESADKITEGRGETVHVERFTEGGTYSVGGQSEAELNVTYNYSRHFKFSSLHGRIAGETIIKLEQRIYDLGTQRDPDYWASTPGNCGHALNILLTWAKQHPKAKWYVS